MAFGIGRSRGLSAVGPAAEERLALLGQFLEPRLLFGDPIAHSVLVPRAGIGGGLLD